MTRHVKQRGQRACKEIVVFEETKNTEVNYEANNKQKLLAAATGCLQQNSQVVVNYRRGKNQHDESRIPPHVKDVTRTQEQELADAKRDAVKQRRHDQKEDPALKAVK